MNGDSKTSITVERRTGLSLLISKVFPFPKKLKPERGTREYRRVRALSAMLITLTVVSFIALLVLCSMTVSPEKQLTNNIAATAAAFLLMFSQLIVFFRFANVRLSAMLLTISYFFIVVGVVIGSGAYDSPNKVLLLSCPIIAFRVGGREEGVVNSCFVGLLGLIFIFARHHGFEVENYFGNLGVYTSSAIAWVVTVAVIATCLAAYDTDEPS